MSEATTDPRGYPATLHELRSYRLSGAFPISPHRADWESQGDGRSRNVRTVPDETRRVTYWYEHLEREAIRGGHMVDTHTGVSNMEGKAGLNGEKTTTCRGGHLHGGQSSMSSMDEADYDSGLLPICLIIR